MATHKSTVDRPYKGDSVLASFDSYVVIDLETTGLVPAFDEIIEFGAVLVEHGNVVETFSSLANPRRDISDNITALTGITNQMLSDSRDISDVLLDFLRFIKDYPLVGHNVSFDINFLYDSAMRHYGHGIDNVHVDTVRLARRIYPSLPDHKLCTCLRHCKIDNSNAHRALSDAICTQKLYEKLKPCILYEDYVYPESVAFIGYTFDHVFNAIQDMIGHDENNVKMKIVKAGASIYMFGTLAFTVRINTLNQRLDTKRAVPEEYLRRIHNSSITNETFHIPIASDSESAEAICELVNLIYDELSGKPTGTPFACCNDFIRCSDLGVCLRKRIPEYSGCQYRKNLEAGRIFYGKNKNC